MSKKIVKKTRVKFLNLFLVLIVFIGLFFGVKLFLSIKTRNIIIEGNDFLSDDYIMDLGNIKSYPKFLTLNSRKTCKRIISNKYISSCKIKKKLHFVLDVVIKENRVLFYDISSEKYVLFDKRDIKEDQINREFRVPRLLNYVPDKKYIKFIEGMGKIDSDTLSKISDIEYQPNDYDKDRFLLYMDDGNMVYLTLTKFKMINHYNEVLTQLEGHKGILYLDSGNHFKIMG